MKLYFDQRGQYWTQTSAGGFIALDKKDAQIELTRHGLEKETYEPNLTKTESVMWRARHLHSVKYSGPVAGYRAGPLELDSGDRVLVATESKFWSVKPKVGRIAFFEKFIETLFDGGQEHVLAWLSCGVKSFERGDFTPAPMLAMVGAVGCGKSFFHWCVTELFGGRVAKPYLWLCGRTNHNEDLMQSEHLCIEDEKSSTDIRVRRDFGAGIKQLTVNPLMHVNGKGKLAMTIQTFRRITASLNPNHIMVLPPMDEDVSDKISLHQCVKAKLHDDKLENQSAFRKELPAVLAFLKSYRVPMAIKCERYGAKAWHDAELLQVLEESQPEIKLLNIIDSLQLIQTSQGWKGSATELEDMLSRSTMAAQTAKLFYYPAACGTYLGKLAGRFPERVSFTRTGTNREWCVKPAGLSLPVPDKKQLLL